jgi:hypothetical protein
MDFSNFNNLLTAGVYYVLVAILIFFSVFSVYILIRYGKSIILSVIGSVLFALLFLAILNNSYNILQSIIS